MEQHIDPAIKLEAITLGYEGKKGVKRLASDITASLNVGTLTCLLGPNGAGKSTLLRTLCRFQRPLEGKIKLFGKPLNEYSQPELARTLGIVLTEKLMVSNLTVRELVELGRSPYTGFWGKLQKEDEEIIGQAMTLTSISHFADRAVSTLSDGERQKAMIAKAIAQATPIILLDEPTAFLDYPSKVEIMRLLHRLSREEGKTVLLSTHDLELALQMADHLWLMDKTLGLRTGTTNDLITRGEVGRYFDREGITFDTQTRVFRLADPR